jgi:hypothetical protein
MDPPAVARIVGDGVVHHVVVVPYGDVTDLPVPSTDQLRPDRVRRQRVQQRLRLGLGQLVDAVVNSVLTKRAGRPFTGLTQTTGWVAWSGLPGGSWWPVRPARNVFIDGDKAS